MNVYIQNQSASRVPRQFIQAWTGALCDELEARDELSATFTELGLIFINNQQMAELNQQFRKKTGPTDVLSFDGLEEGHLGELVFALPLVKEQAVQHKLSLRLEIGYLIVHGVLHLLGYDHETNQEDAEQMFSLQDDLFETLCQKFEPGKR